MFNPLSGANRGTEDFFHTSLGEAIGGMASCFRLGGYMVQSNQVLSAGASDGNAPPLELSASRSTGDRASPLTSRQTSP
jgi:hypothetical protein